MVEKSSQYVFAKVTEPRQVLRSRRSYLVMEDYSQELLQAMTPKSYYDLMANFSVKEIEEWHEAMEKEIASLWENCTWIYKMCPDNRDQVDCKWLNKIKRDRDNKLLKKARLVVKGYQQIEGWDYDVAFAPVIGFETLRRILLYSTMRGWTLRQYDFSTAVLNADMDQHEATDWFCT